MQIVIDIPEDKYFLISHDWWVNQYSTTKQLFDYIKNGTPLPKGHGRLFDERNIVNGNYQIIGNKIYELEPIIEADSEVE